MNPPGRPTAVWYALVVLFLCGLLVAGMSLHWSVEAKRHAERVDERSNAQWCSLLVVLDDAYRRSPPATQAGQGLARAVAGLRVSFHCDAPRAPLGSPSPTSR